MANGKRASDRNKELMQRFYDEVVNGDDLELIDELLGADFVDHEAPEGQPPGREGVKQIFRNMRQAFPDLQFTVEHMIAEGDTVAVRVRVRGTHSGGEFMGIPSRGRSVDFTAMDMLEFSDGVATVHWGVSDVMTMMMQLGALPETG